MAYDGGAEHVTPLAGITAHNCQAAVEGAIFTRPPNNKKDTALFIGGSDMQQGEAVLSAVKANFFSGFRVSVMLDSNGGNTTAAATVSLLSNAVQLTGKTALVLAGTGAVGSLASILLAREGAQVRVASRSKERSEAICNALSDRFEGAFRPVSTGDDIAKQSALDGIQVIVAAGKAGVQLLERGEWQNLESLEVIADVSTASSAGVQGIELMDRDAERAGKKTFGGIGIGALKLRVHRACIERVFESNHHVLDTLAIYGIAKDVVSNQLSEG